MSSFTDLSDTQPDVSALKPIRVLEVEIGKPLPAYPAHDPATGYRYMRGLALVRLHSIPLGTVNLQIGEDGLSATELAHQIWDSLSREINQHLQDDALPPTLAIGIGGLSSPDAPKCTQERSALLDRAPMVSVAVATRDRPTSLATCLNSLLMLDYPKFEIIVVDNAPTSNATADLIKQKYGDVSHIHYVREEQPGLASAHNRAVAEAQGTMIAFTDDDVVVDRYWLAELAKNLVSDQVGCVTGTIIPAELETPSQIWIEQFGGFSKGFARHVFEPLANWKQNPLYPYAAGRFGSGANMAFKTSVLRAMGGFDPATGTGTPARGGDDLSAFFELITRGYHLVYEPAAIVYHWHRRDYAGLRRQVYGYGVGLTAYLTKTLVDRPSRVFDLAARIPFGIAYLLSPQSPKNAKKRADYPGELTVIERKGMLYGPVAYLWSRWQSRKNRTSYGCTANVSPSPASLADEIT